MKVEIKIQGYWGAEVYTWGKDDPQLDENLEKCLKDEGSIILCDISVDGKFFVIKFDGEKLLVEEDKPEE